MTASEEVPFGGPPFYLTTLTRRCVMANYIIIGCLLIIAILIASLIWTAAKHITYWIVYALFYVLFRKERLECQKEEEDGVL